MIRFAIALVVGGAILAFFGYNENKLASAAETDPQTLTAAQLIEQGYGENAHIILTDFWLLDEQSVVEYEGNNQDKYTKLWSPIILPDDPYIAKYYLTPAEEAAPAYDGKIHAVLYSKAINDDAAFYELLKEGAQVQGLIVNAVEKIKGEELKLLQQNLPGIDPDKVLIIEHNRKPKSGGVTILMMAGGVLLMLAGPGLFFVTRKRS